MPAESGKIVEIRPADTVRVCPSCLVHNTRGDDFCTACGSQLPEAEPSAAAGKAAVTGSTPAAEAHAPSTLSTSASTMISPPVPNAAFEPELALGRRLRGTKLVPLVVALVAAVAGFVAFAALWQIQTSHTNRLQRDLAATRANLSATKTKLAATNAALASATSLSDKRRTVLMQAKDVVAKVDPLLSAVDNIQRRASNLSGQGSSMAGDAEALITTTIDLVNYLIKTSGSSYVDYTWVQQEADLANSQLDTLRYDESTFSSGESSYGDASKSFGVQADAFSSSVRALQKQLKAVTQK